MKRALLAATFLALPLAAYAQPVTGLYIGAGVGGNFMQPEKQKFVTQFSSPASTFVGAYKTDFDTGIATVGSVGYGFGNGVRVEVEGDYRYNKFSQSSSNPAEEKYGGMANALFDFDIGSPYVWPYAGVGAGYMHVEHGYSNYTTNSFAYQGIAGISVPLPFLVGLSATLEYRFQALAGAKRTDIFATAGGGTATNTTKYEDELNHSLMIGLRYAFYVPPPPAPAAPAAPAAAPAPQPARSYLVFFDWDRVDLTERARQIIAEAAQNVARIQHTRIEVDGHADRSGTPQYNLALSMRRAQTVAAELVRDGVAKSVIDIHAFGDTKPLVPTAAGVREPQNRRVEIVIH